MSQIDTAKKLACFTAIDAHLDATTEVIGIGSGSTIVFLIERLKEIKSKFPKLKACIPTSFQSKNLIIEAGLPLGELNQFPDIHVTFDGADEVDSNLNLIKGGGACQLQEKLVASNSRKLIIVADYRKNSDTLGEQWKAGVPLEVIPMAYAPILLKLKALGSINPVLRMAKNKAGPVITDNGNFVIDADFGLISDPVQLEKSLISIPGIVETGLFCGMAQAAYFGMDDGTVKTQTIN